MTPPYMRTVDSSTISSIGYDGRNLLVKFKTGGLYKYYSVPEDYFRRFETAIDKRESIGKLFARTIRNRFRYEKLLR